MAGPLELLLAHCPVNLQYELLLQLPSIAAPQELHQSDGRGCIDL